GALGRRRQRRVSLGRGHHVRRARGLDSERGSIVRDVRRQPRLRPRQCGGSSVSGKTETMTSGAAGLAGKYMTFRLASEVYGLEILKVRELIGLLEITRIPRAPVHVRGVINLRGKVIPVVDLRRKFELEPIDATSQTVIIVVQLAAESGGLTMGILVDEVLEV